MTDSRRIFSYIPGLSRLTGRKSSRKPSQVELNLQNLEARVTPAAALTSDLLQPGLAALQLGGQVESGPRVEITAAAGTTSTDARLLNAAYVAAPVNQPVAPAISLMVNAPSANGSLVANPSYSSSTISVSPYKLQLNVRDPLAGMVQQGASQAFASLRAFSQSPAFAGTLKEVFGGNANAALLRYGLTQNGINIRVQLVSGSELPGARAAYTPAGPDGIETIYLNRDWLSKSRSVSEVRDLLIEELGHALDVRVNGAKDSAGDEGDLFMRRVTGKAISADTLAALKVEDDHATVTIAGKRVAIEMATAPFQGAYKLLETDNESANATTTSAVVGTNFGFTSADPTQVQFSGNNVPGTFSYTDSNNQTVRINGEVSRLIKDKGLQAVYFHTVGFDNVGSWMLVVNPSYFQNNTTYKTSSDPVDQALNGLISPAPTQTTTITSVTDDVAPQTGTVLANGYTNDTTPLLSGTISAALGTSEVVAIFRDGTYIGVATVSGTNWTFADSGLANGTNYTYTARVVNSSTQAAAPLSNSYSIKVDTLAPALTFNAITGDDNITAAEKTAGVTLAGTTEAGSTVTISYLDKNGNTVTRNATVDGSGNWTYALTAADWTNIGSVASVKFTATATDAAGNFTSTARTALLTPPAMAIPGLPDLLAADDTGSSSTDNLTSKTVVQLSVSIPNTGATPALPGQWLEVVNANGVVLGSHVLTEDDIRAGTFTFRTPTLTEGTHEISSRLVDTVANTTSYSQGSLLLTIDKSAPAFSVVSIGDDTGASATDKITSDRNLTITGTGEPGSTINVYDNGVLVGTAVVGPDGKYSVTTSPLADGSHPLTITATDPAGNVNGPVSLGTWLIDTTAPVLSNLAVSDDTGISPTDKVTSDRELTVTGTTEPNVLVKVYDSTSGTPVLVGQGYSDNTGKFSVTTSTLADGQHPLTITGTDAAGNESQPTSLGTWLIDSTKPAAPTNLAVSEDTGASPTDKVTSDRNLTVTGTAEPNSLVKVYDSSSGSPVLVGQGYADANGNFSVTTSTLADGPHPLTITATDLAGNESNPASLGTWLIDSTKPAAPTNLAVSEDTGASPTDKVTSDRNLTVTGTAEPNSLVKVYDSSSGTPVLVGQGYADANGNFSVTTSTLADGPHPLTISATDLAGNESNPASLGTWLIDSTKPATPTNLAVSEDTGASPTDKVTSDRNLTVTGTAEPNSLVKVYDSSSGTPVLVGQGYADANGNFSVTTSTLADGPHPLTISATDLAGNESNPASLGTWLIDSTKPAAPQALSISEDTADPTDKLTSDRELTVTGIAEPNSLVKVYDSSSGTPVLVGQGYADANGNFSVTTSPLADGQHPLTITATDLAGNESAPTNLGIWTIDGTKPASPTVVSIGEDTGNPSDKVTSDNTLTITGTGEPGSTITVYANGLPVGTAVVGPNGKYSVTTSPLADGSYPISITSTDKAGNESAPTSLGTWVIDTRAPQSPAVVSIGEDTADPTDKVTGDNTLTITGTGEPGSTITVYADGVPVGTAVVGPDGTYSVTTSPLADGAHPISITATDPAGNESAPTDLGVWVIDTEAPAAPQVASVSIDTNKPDDKVTSDNVLTVTGTAEPNSLVKVYDSSSGTPVLVGQGYADANGNYSIDTAVLADGEHPLSVTATDKAGNESLPTDLGTWIIDTTAPAQPAITGFGEDTGNPGDGFTQDNDLFLVGTAEPNSMVEVFDNGVSLGVVQADANGNWRLPTTGVLAEGPHSFTIQATDLAGNVSEPSNPLALNVTKPLASASPTGEQSMAFTIDRNQADDVLTVGGTGPWTYAVADGQLPDGLSIDPNTGAISGTAERLQDVVVEVLVTDANGETVRIPIRIVIEAAAKPLLVSSGVGTNTNLGNIPSSMVNGYTYGDGTAVTLYDTTDFLPSGQTVPFVGYKGEVRVSLDDLDGNGRPDIVAAAGVGAQPHIRVLDIETGTSRMSFLAFDQGYRGGMFVSTGDINGDHHADIAVVSGIGSRSHVKVFDGKTGAEIASFYAFEEGFTGGATLAVGDTDGDGIAEIIVGKGPGDLPLVRVFEQGANGWQMRSEFLGFEQYFRGGVFVAVGDIGGDNRIEIAVGANAGASASVALFDAKTKNFIDQFYAYGQLDNVGPFKGGARVAIEDYNRDGVAELITGAGPGSYPHLRVWEVDQAIREIASLLVAESGYTGGVHLG